MKKAFTLIEMLVVIGIIGVLTAVLIGTFSGSTESARGIKCLANMHSLANAWASLSGENAVGAGSMESTAPFQGVHMIGDELEKIIDSPGWISWYTGGALPHLKKDGNPTFVVTRESGVETPTWFKSTYETDDKIRTYCLTNGVIWAAVGRNRDVYVCPKHVDVARGASYGGKKIKSPCWSYAMCGKSDVSVGTEPLASGGIDQVSQKAAGKASVTLLLCELPFVKIDQIGQNPTFSADTGAVNDPTLQYPGIPGPDGGTCPADPECIAFNHTAGRDYLAHICFADGHVEKLRMIKKMSRTTVEQLTRWLANGLEFDFDGASGSYRLMEGVTDTSK